MPATRRLDKPPARTRVSYEHGLRSSLRCRTCKRRLQHCRIIQSPVLCHRLPSSSSRRSSRAAKSVAKPAAAQTPPASPVKLEPIAPRRPRRPRAAARRARPAPDLERHFPSPSQARSPAATPHLTVRSPSQTLAVCLTRSSTSLPSAKEIGIGSMLFVSRQSPSTTRPFALATTPCGTLVLRVWIFEESARFHT